jgi:hypothetical protein
VTGASSGPVLVPTGAGGTALARGLPHDLADSAGTGLAMPTRAIALGIDLARGTATFSVADRDRLGRVAAR